MDIDVGRILDRLEEHSIRDDTLVVFTSDNGFSCGHHGFWGKGNGTYPLNMYENSIKVPFVVSHPGRINTGIESGMFSAIDFMPTLLDYAGVGVPDTLRLPGKSFARMLDGSAAASRDSVVIYDEYGSTRMVRTVDWKYVHRYPDGPHELYHLEEDPDERVNLAGETAHAGRIGEMLDIMESWFADHSSQEKDGRNLPVIGGGQLRPVGGVWEDGSPAFTDH